MAAELGFEPRQTESESVVLPLHNSAILSFQLFAQRVVLYHEKTDLSRVFTEKNYILHF